MRAWIETTRAAAGDGWCPFAGINDQFGRVAPSPVSQFVERASHRVAQLWVAYRFAGASLRDADAWMRNRVAVIRLSSFFRVQAAHQRGLSCVTRRRVPLQRPSLRVTTLSPTRERRADVIFAGEECEHRRRLAATPASAICSSEAAQFQHPCSSACVRRGPGER